MSILLTLLLVIPDVALSYCWIWSVRKIVDQYMHAKEGHQKQEGKKVSLFKRQIIYQDASLAPEKPDSSEKQKLIVLLLMALPEYCRILLGMVIPAFFITDDFNAFGCIILEAIIVVFWFVILIIYLLILKPMEWIGSHADKNPIARVLQVLLLIPSLWIALVVEYMPYLLLMTPIYALASIEK